MYAILINSKLYPHTKFEVSTSNNTQICPGLDLSRNEARAQARAQGHSDPETVDGHRRPAPRCISIQKLKLKPSVTTETVDEGRGITVRDRNGLGDREMDAEIYYAFKGLFK